MLKEASSGRAFHPFTNRMIHVRESKLSGILAGVAFYRRFYAMCTAYESGKRGGSFPEHNHAEVIDELLKISETRLIRPTLAAPVILPDRSLRKMSGGFPRKFATKVKGRKAGIHQPAMIGAPNNRSRTAYRIKAARIPKPV